jgi:hypothetical protein
MVKGVMFALITAIAWHSAQQKQRHERRDLKPLYSNGHGLVRASIAMNTATEIKPCG